jgi:uncharacterized membrane protein YkoI
MRHQSEEVGMFTTRMRIVLAGATLALAGVSGAALASGGAATATRLDDGADLISKAGITEAQAIAAAQTRATGALNEVDLEYAGERLVYNVDVGTRDVAVDAASGEVVAISSDD